MLYQLLRTCLKIQTLDATENEKMAMAQESLPLLMLGMNAIQVHSIMLDSFLLK